MSIFLLLLIVALIQWLLLRNHFNRAWLMILANLIGFIFTSILSIALGIMLSLINFKIFPLFKEFDGALLTALCAGICFGVTYALCFCLLKKKTFLKDIDS